MIDQTTSALRLNLPKRRWLVSDGRHALCETGGMRLMIGSER